MKNELKARKSTPSRSSLDERRRRIRAALGGLTAEEVRNLFDNGCEYAASARAVFGNRRIIVR